MPEQPNTSVNPFDFNHFDVLRDMYDFDKGVEKTFEKLKLTRQEEGVVRGKIEQAYFRCLPDTFTLEDAKKELKNKTLAEAMILLHDHPNEYGSKQAYTIMADTVNELQIKNAMKKGIDSILDPIMPGVGNFLNSVTDADKKIKANDAADAAAKAAMEKRVEALLPTKPSQTDQNKKLLTNEGNKAAHDMLLDIGLAVNGFTQHPQGTITEKDNTIILEKRAEELKKLKEAVALPTSTVELTPKAATQLIMEKWNSNRADVEAAVKNAEQRNREALTKGFSDISGVISQGIGAAKSAANEAVDVVEKAQKNQKILTDEIRNKARDAVKTVSDAANNAARFTVGALSKVGKDMNAADAAKDAADLQKFSERATALLTTAQLGKDDKVKIMAEIQARNSALAIGDGIYNATYKNIEGGLKNTTITDAELKNALTELWVSERKKNGSTFGTENIMVDIADKSRLTAAEIIEKNGIASNTRKGFTPIELPRGCDGKPSCGLILNTNQDEQLYNIGGRGQPAGLEITNKHRTYTSFDDITSDTDKSFAITGTGPLIITFNSNQLEEAHKAGKLTVLTHQNRPGKDGTWTSITIAGKTVDVQENASGKSRVSLGEVNEDGKLTKKIISAENMETALNADTQRLKDVQKLKVQGLAVTNFTAAGMVGSAAMPTTLADGTFIPTASMPNKQQAAGITPP